MCIGVSIYLHVQVLYGQLVSLFWEARTVGTQLVFPKFYKCCWNVEFKKININC